MLTEAPREAFRAYYVVVGPPKKPDEASRPLSQKRRLRQWEVK